MREESPRGWGQQMEWCPRECDAARGKEQAVGWRQLTAGALWEAFEFGPRPKFEKASQRAIHWRIASGADCQREERVGMGAEGSDGMRVVATVPYPVSELPNRKHIRTSDSEESAKLAVLTN